jgi:hypothetical protein
MARGAVQLKTGLYSTSFRFRPAPQKEQEDRKLKLGLPKSGEGVDALKYRHQTSHERVQPHPIIAPHLMI